MGAKTSQQSSQHDIPLNTSLEDFSAEISDLKDSIQSLQYQVSKVQEENQRELKSLRREVSELATTMKNLSAKNHQLQAQLNQQLQANLGTHQIKKSSHSNGMHNIIGVDKKLVMI